MNNILPPKYLYKYKSLLTSDDLDTIKSIISDHQIYMPTYTQLNDPAEGGIIDISSPGYAGCGNYICADEEDPFIKSNKERFRILSLTDNPASGIMWAHYATQYKGVCLCYSTSGSFSNAEPVIYRNARETYFLDYEALDSVIKSSFYYKQEDWSYEHEWRILSETENLFFKYEPKELVGIIIGHAIKEHLKKELVDYIRENENLLTVLKSEPGYRTLKVNIMEYDYQYRYELGYKKTINNLTCYFDSQKENSER